MTHIAVWTGAAVSPQHAVQSGLSQEVCPWCLKDDVVPTWEHCCWECQLAPRPVAVRGPLDALQRRLGWLTAMPARAAVDVEIAKWMASVREAVLSRRHAAAMAA